MALAETADVFPAQTWPQLDARDPLGLWGGKLSILGDASGSPVRFSFQVEQARRAAFVFACYGVTWAQQDGATISTIVKTRLLTNWPNIDPQLGVQGYGTNNIVSVGGGGGFGAPEAAPLNGERMLQSTDRFILMYDPRPGIGTALTLVEIEQLANQDGTTTITEVWGYYWDRSVMETPGGPRHPGSS